MDQNEIDAFVTEGVSVVDVNQAEEAGLIEQAGSDEQTAVPEVQNKEELEVKSESAKEAVAAPAEEAFEAVKDILTPKQGSTQIPVHVAQELREEKRQLKAQIEALKAQLATKQDVDTRPGAGNPVVEDDLEDMQDFDDDDFLTGSQVKSALRKQKAVLEKRIESLISEREQKAVSLQKAAQIEQATKETAAKYADFGKITKLGIPKLTDEDRQKIQASDNPAEALYARCKEAVAEEAQFYKELLGIEEEKPKTRQVTGKSQQEILKTPEDVFDEMFNR